MSNKVKIAAIVANRKVPETNQILPPWNSVIHWLEIYKAHVPSINRTYTKTYVPVTCGKCTITRPCLVHRGLERSGQLTQDCLSHRGETFTGLCQRCSRRKFRQNQEIPNGAWILWEEFNQENGLPFICAQCKEKLFIKRKGKLYPSSYIDKNFTGRCFNCTHSCRTDDIDHLSGAKIRPSLRDPENKDKWGYVCLDCKRIAYTWPHVFGPKWRGCCPECRDLRRIIEDVTQELTGSRILNSRRRGNQVPVICGLCGQENLFHIKRTRGRLGENFTGFCTKHTRREIALLLQSKSQTGNGQKNGSIEKRKAGRKTGSTTTDPKQTVDDIQSQVSSLKSGGYSYRDVTANLVASRLHIGGVTGGDTMMRRVNKGFKIDWPALKEFLWNGGRVDQLEFNSR